MIYAFFPIFAAMFYGLAFAFTEKAVQTINVATYIFWVAIIELFIALGLMKFKSEQLSFDFLQSKTDTAIILTAVIAPSLGWIFTTYAIKTTSATYASFAEISYPLFTLIFLFAFFGLRSVDWTILVGGGLILAGSFLMIYGQSKAHA